MIKLPIGLSSHKIIAFTAVFLLGVSNGHAALIEEIVVTAQKREQSLQDVGISVTAFSGEQISRLGYDDTTDILAQTPGLLAQNFHPVFTTINIRGVSQNDFTDHLEAPVAIYQDEVYNSIIYMSNVGMFDIERVEVLRGPQGTLFGRNATGGLMHFVSKKPTEEFSGYGQLSFAEYNQVKFEGAVSGPMAQGLYGRLSVTTNSHDGYLENRIGKDKYDRDSRQIRGQLQYTPSDELDIWLKVQYTTDSTVGNGYPHQPSTIGSDSLGTFIGRNELGTFFDFAGVPFTTCPGCDGFGFRNPDPDFLKTSSEFDGRTIRDSFELTGKVTWNTGSITVESITNYIDANKSYSEDTDGSPIAQFVFFQSADSQQFSQEVRIKGESDQLTWIAGAYYLKTEHGTGTLLIEDLGQFAGFGPVPPGLIIFNTRHNSSTEGDSWALFGHAEYSLTDDLLVIAALRYTEDDKELDWMLSDNFGTQERLSPDLAFSTFFDPVSNSIVSIDADTALARQTFENVSAKLSLDWHPTDDLLLYASYVRGHKSGNFATPFVGPLVDFSDIPHDEEVLTSYEIGFKSTLMGGRARLNGSLFYYDYDDYQGSFFANVVQIVRNLDARAYGAEVELAASPTEGLDLALGMSWLDSKVKDVGLPNGLFVDRDLPLAAEITLNGLARYEWPVVNGMMSVQADFNYVDDMCFSLVCNHTEKESPYVVGNARLSFDDSSGHWTVSAFVNNLGDEEYRINGLDVSSVGITISVPAPPRWFGGSVTYRW